MKQKIERMVSLFLSAVLITSLLCAPASAVGINDDSVFLKQPQGSSTCTLMAATMMLRRHAILDGASDWNTITDSSVRPVGWVEGKGLRTEKFTYRGLTIKAKNVEDMTLAEKKAYFISTLEKYPEGIEIYNSGQPHAVLLTDYDSSTKTFYCADPAGGSRGRIKLVDSTMWGKPNQDNIIRNIDQIWYIARGCTYVSPNGSSGGSAPKVTSTISGKWIVTIPANYKVLCYDAADSMIDCDYRKPREKDNTITCTQKATLSNGNVRYYYTTSDNRGLWFDFTSSMTVENTGKSTYTVTFDANGGKVGEKERRVPAGSALDSLPVPTRSGYTFVGWCNSNGASGLLVNAYNFKVEQDCTLYAWWKENSQNSGHWGPWSEWGTKVYTASATRQVETKTVETVEAHKEYRYGRYIDQTGTHNCWCGKYLESLSTVSGKAKLDYSKWSTTRYSASGAEWTCGQCGGKHQGVDHVDSRGRPIWVEYRVSGKPYYWEETRTVEAKYETQYRYRDWIAD